MKFKLTALLAIAALVCFTACSDDDDDASSVAPTLSSSQPEHGATGVSVDLSEIVLTYDRDVYCLGNFDFNGTTISLSRCDISGATVTIDISDIELDYGTKYTLTIPAGQIMSQNQSASTSEHSITFNTEEAEDEETVVDIDTELAMANDFSAAKSLYNYLLESYGSYVLSGAIANVNWNFDEVNLIYEATGKYPAMATMDYIHMTTLRDDSPWQYWTVDYTDISEVEQWWNDGGIVSACWHWLVPASEDAVSDDSGYTSTYGETTFDAKNIFTEGTWEQIRADEDLEIVANCLLLLQDAGIPVIWRPLHEAAGNTYSKEYSGTAWFWWGADAATYVQLWQYMYDYFADKGLNNLIWVWTSESTSSSSYGDDDDYYPGDDYVDIIGLDLYTKTAAECAKDFKYLQKKYPNKLITLSEMGDVDNISDQWAAGGCWSYFMPWYDYDVDNTSYDLSQHQHADTDWWIDAMNCQYVITRDELPSFTE